MARNPAARAPAARRTSVRLPARDLLVFGLKEARSCLFPGLFVLVLLLSGYVTLGLARYDFIFLASVTIQIALVVLRVESRDEVLTLGTFHALGLGLELFKTHPAIGSWGYPEEGFFEVGDVPLYSGFMYAAVASYMCQAWRVMDLEVRGMPSCWLSVPLSAAIYLNFFTHHFLWDARWVLALGVLVVFWRTRVSFTTTRRRSMPLVLAFGLMGSFVYGAENVSTYLGAWAYPHQLSSWSPVALAKVSSWTLLVIVSFVIVADLKHARARRRSVR